MNDDHHHCRVCGKVSSPDTEVCSSTCRDRREKQRESRRNATYVMYGLMAVLIVLLLANNFGL